MPPKPAKKVEEAPPAAPPPPPDPLVLFGPDVSLVKPKVAAAFRAFDPEGTGAVRAEDCLPILHSLRVFVTEAEFRDTMLQELLLPPPVVPGAAPPPAAAPAPAPAAAGAAGAAAAAPPPAAPAPPAAPPAPSTTHVQYAALEKKALELLEARAFEPEPQDALLSAFRALDKGNSGSLDADRLKELLQGGAYGVAPPAQPMSEAEWAAFLAVLPQTTVVDEATEKTRVMVHYEDYVAMVAPARAAGARRR